MRNNSIEREYFDWMCEIVCEDRTQANMYEALLSYLYEKPFWAVLTEDENRVGDGINLRYRFSYDIGLPQSIIATTLDNRDCSVLEVMVALALRCEESIMHDPTQGDRTSVWFWSMIESLGIDYTDGEFDICIVEPIVNRFINREYAADGRGSLFYIAGYPYDMRNIEIWYQLHRYLASTQLS